MKETDRQISIDERIQNEKDMYNKGIDREKYNSAFGYASGGYAADRKKELWASVLQKEKGKKILEIGSTSWKQYIDFKNFPPAELVCINISEKAVDEGIKLAEKHHTSEYSEHSFKVMDAHKLEFPDQSFDIVFGKEILHHLDFELSIKEIARVLKKDGQMIFSEPLQRNPVGRLVRRMTPDKRTAFEKPLNKKEIKILKRYFDLGLTFHQLFYVPAGVISKRLFKSPKNPMTRGAYKFDLFLERVFRKTNIGLYYRQVVIIGRVKQKTDDRS